MDLLEGVFAEILGTVSVNSMRFFLILCLVFMAICMDSSSKFFGMKMFRLMRFLVPLMHSRSFALEVGFLDNW